MIDERPAQFAKRIDAISAQIASAAFHDRIRQSGATESIVISCQLGHSSKALTTNN